MSIHIYVYMYALTINEKNCHRFEGQYGRNKEQLIGMKEKGEMF